MIRKTPLAFLVTFAMVVAGCGSSPPVRYFALESPVLEYVQENDAAPAMAMGPLRVPDYLDRSQMVTRGANSEILVDGKNRWAEPVDKAIHRTLARNVDAQLSSLVVIAHPATSMIEPDYRLVGRVDRFDVDESGLAVFELQWGVGSYDGDTVIPARRSRFTSAVVRPGDPGSSASALSDTLLQFSRVVAADMEAMLARSEGDH